MTTMHDEQTTPGEPTLGGSTWNTFTRDTTMTAHEYVDAISVLLQGVLESNGNQQPNVLIDQLRATLSIGGPHSALPQSSAVTRPGKQLFAQAERIGDQLSIWADEALGRVVDRPEPLTDPLDVRSHCDGHTLIPAAIHILLGPEGGPTPMMLYNEWIHQMVLLRDALVPFTNWAEVPLPLDSRGLRRLEEPREAFLSELLIRQIRHTSIVAYAREVLVPHDHVRAPGYGFVYAGGRVMPAVATSASILCDPDLLTWLPARDNLDPRSAVETYVSGEIDYFETTRISAAKVVHLGSGSSLATSMSRITEASAEAGTRRAAVEVTLRTEESDRSCLVDLGQALRGHRYAYRAGFADDAAPREVTNWFVTATAIGADHVLLADGMIWDEEGDFAIEAGQDGLVALALLGAIYPENVIVRRRSDNVDPRGVGKSGPARFVITLPDGTLDAD